MIKIKSILDIIDNYDNYIIDQWGVMHDGYFGYEHAIEAINYLEKKIKTCLSYLIPLKDKNHHKINFLI